KVRGPRPARVLKALRELAPVEVALDLDHHDARVTVERNDVEPAPSQKSRLPLHEKQRLAHDLLGVRPDKLLDLAFVEICAASQPSKRSQFPGSVDLEERHSRSLIWRSCAGLAWLCFATSPTGCVF